MTTYRVGDQGATVFDADGAPVLYLRPGQVVIPGSTELTGTPAAQHHDEVRKRIRHYHDKRLHPSGEHAP